jgi:hypothetical protein
VLTYVDNSRNFTYVLYLSYVKAKLRTYDKDNLDCWVMMIIRVALFFISCIHAILCLRCFPSPRVVAATRHSSRLFKRVYHNDDGSFDVDSAPKLSFNENFYRVLEVDSNCSQKDLKKSFLKMIFTYHPDRISRGSS